MANGTGSREERRLGDRTREVLRTVGGQEADVSRPQWEDGRRVAVRGARISSSTLWYVWYVWCGCPPVSDPGPYRSPGSFTVGGGDRRARCHFTETESARTTEVLRPERSETRGMDFVGGKQQTTRLRREGGPHLGPGV